MEEKQSPLTFRASDQDRKIIADLIAWTGLKMASVIRLALRRLHDEESERHKSKAASRARKG